MRVVVTGGGTGGHIYAAVSFAQACQSRLNSEVLYVGSESGLEKRIADDAGIEFKGKELSGVAGARITGKVKSLFLFIKGFKWCRGIVNDFKPDCVIGTGGYVSAPACFAAISKNVPVILHEMNYEPGMVTKLLAGRAYAVALAYENTSEKLSGKANNILTGIPVRKEIEELRDKNTRMKAEEEALAEFGLKEKRKTLLVFGGSQGASAINEALWRALPHLAKRGDLQILHLTGRRGYNEERIELLREKLKGGELIYRVFPFSERMDLAYAVSTVAVTRGGAGTLAELTVAELPSVIVPYPYAAEDHQARNAQILFEAGAAEMIRQSGDNADEPIAAALRLIDDEKRLREMRSASADVYLGDGTNGIIGILNGISSAEEKAGNKGE